MRNGWLSVFALFALSTGCEPDTIGGVDRDRLLASLSVSESEVLCAEFDRRFDEAERDPVIKRGACLYTARAFAENEVARSGGDELALCEERLSTCLEELPKVGFNCRQAFPLCPNRVRELDTCTWLALEEFRAASDGACGDEADTHQESPPGWPTYAECARLHALCFPNLEE